MQNLWKHLSFTMMPQSSSIVRSHLISVVSVVYCHPLIVSKQNKAANAISLGIEESLESEVGNHINFANDILKNEAKGEQKIYYSLVKYKKKVYYDILKDISENGTLFQFMDSLGNVNRDIIVVGYWIFDSKYKKSLVINIESLGMICASSFGEEQASKF